MGERKLRFPNWFRVILAALALLVPAAIAWAKTAVEGRIPNESGLIELYVTGGVFMHPILICSVVGLAIILERLYFFAKARTNTRRLLGELLHVLQDQGFESAQRMLHSGLLRAKKGPEAVEKAIQTAASIQTAGLERGLIWLATVANIAPLLGFLGTVSGMIHAFEAIAAAEEVSAKLVATGIYEALITTAAGLIVAIPVQTAHNYFVSRIDKFVIDVEESGAELVDALATHSRQWETFLSTLKPPSTPITR